MSAIKKGNFYHWGNADKPKFSIKKLGEARAKELAENLGKFIVEKNKKKSKKK